MARKRTQQRPPKKNLTERECPACGVTHISYRRATCSDRCYEAMAKMKSGKARKAVYNDFLPPDAEENQGKGTWVPSPDEIDWMAQEKRTFNEIEMRDKL